jgi:hypothetical protein
MFQEWILESLPDHGLSQCNCQVLRNLVHDCTLGNSRLVHTVPSNKGDGTVTLLEWTISSNIGEMLHIALERQDLLVKRVVEAVIALCECGCPEGVTTTMLVIVVDNFQQYWGDASYCTGETGPSRKESSRSCDCSLRMWVSGRCDNHNAGHSCAGTMR